MQINRERLFAAKSRDHYFETDHLLADLNKRSATGGFIITIAQALRLVLNIGSISILARLLTPKDYGLIAMVVAITAFAELFKDLGLSMATVQQEQITQEQVSTLFWVNLSVGLAITVLLCGVSPIISWFYGDSRLILITCVLATTFIFGGLSVQHQALLRRQMRFFSLAAIDIGSYVISVCWGIALAAYGAGYWALVFMQLALAASTAAGLWIGCAWRPGLPARGTGVRNMLRFGGNLTVSKFLSYLASNLDKILIGKYLSAQQLGFYTKAYQLMLLPITQINAPISNVAIAALSRLKDDPGRYQGFYLKAVKLIAFATMPLVAIMFAYSAEIIDLILGPQWKEASKIFLILAIAAFIQPIANTSGWISISLNQTDRLAKWSSIEAPTIIVAMIIGLQWGTIGVATSYAICIYLLRYPGFVFLYRYSPIKLKDLSITLSGPVILSVTMGFAMIITKSSIATSSKNLPQLLGLAAGLCVLWLYLWIFPSARKDIKDLVQTMRRAADVKK